MGSIVKSVTGFFGGQNDKHAAKNVISTYNTTGQNVIGQYNQALDASRQINSPLYDVGLGGARGAANMLQPGYDFQSSDPSYQWRLNQGLGAVEHSAAANGLLHSGGAMKALNNYAQGAASQEFQNQFARQNTLGGYAQPAATALTNSYYSTANGIGNAAFKAADGVAGAYGMKADALNNQNGAVAGGATALAQFFGVPGF